MVEHSERTTRKGEDRLDQAFFALAHPTRRALLQAVIGMPRANVTRLAASFRVSLNAVSKHLKVLEAGRLIRRERIGREHVITAEQAGLDDASRWIAECHAFWGPRLDKMEEVIHEQAASSNNTQSTKPNSRGRKTRNRQRPPNESEQP